MIIILPENNVKSKPLEMSSDEMCAEINFFFYYISYNVVVKSVWSAWIKSYEITGGTIYIAIIGAFLVYLKEKKSFHSFWPKT